MRENPNQSYIQVIAIEEKLERCPNISPGPAEYETGAREELQANSAVVCRRAL